MKKFARFVLINIFCLSAFAEMVSGQCPSGAEYPFHICPGNNIVCMSCPKTQLGPGQSVLGAGLPTSICIDDARTGSTDGNIGMFVQNNGPCSPNKVADVFDVSYMNADANAALNAWKGICSPNPTTDCCWIIELASDGFEFTADGYNPDNDPAFTSGLKCGVPCSQKKTVLNFTPGFMRQTPTSTGDTDEFGNPCDFKVFTTSFFNPELENNVTYTPSSGELSKNLNNFLNVEDILIHELGHLLGYPDEKVLENSGLPCALNGVMHSKSWDDDKTPNDIGFPSDDPARCWFKLTYCDADCTAAVESQTPANGLEAVIFPDPSVSNSKLKYNLVKPTNVQISIYDILGKQMQTVFSGFQDEGLHMISLGTELLPAGTYICRLSSGNEVKSLRFSITK